MPYENLNGQDDAGAVSVLYGTTEGLSSTGDQFWHQDSPDVLDVAEAGDRFGYSLATADFGGVTTPDLAIGVPYETIQAPLDEHGVVNVLYGSSTGLTTAGNQLWWQDSTGVNDLAEAGDSFGKTLTARNFGSGARSDLAVGVPLEDVGAADDAGGVSVLYGTATGLSAAGDQFWTQDSTGIGDAAEFLDEFGRAVVGVT